jgi:Zn-dependent metalloprotease
MSSFSHRIRLSIAALLVCASISFSAQAQRLKPTPPAESPLVQQLRAATDQQVRVSYHAETGKVRFVGTTPEHPIAPPAQLVAGATPEQAARAFLTSYGPLFGAADQAQELRVAKVYSAGRGRSTVRFQQVYQGVPILGGELNVQLTAEQAVLAANGELQPDLSLSVTPAVSAATARQTALHVIAKHTQRPPATLAATTPQLWIYTPALLGGPGLPRPTLVWRTAVTAGALDALQELVLVDAQRGTVALHFNQLAYAKERSVCDRNNVVNANDVCTPATAVRSEGQGPTGITDVDLAYDYAGLTYDFYNTKFGRDSLDGAGLPLRSTVRFCPDAANCPYENAYWNGSQMVYGDGFPAADDVVGHELTHGVTDFTSSLFYYYQSGAINESLSDVFGEFIDLTYDTASDNDSPAVRWKLGEDVPGFGAIRDMQDPTVFGDPDKITSANYTADPNELDNGGVHQNSGVNNKAAYLLTDGATFNGRTVTGLGIDKVARIYYEAETNLLLSASDYNDLYDYLQQACLTLTGTAGITAADCQEVKDAVDATEMNVNPPAASAPDAPICGAAQTPNNVYSDDFENPASGRWTSSATVGQNNWYYPQTSNPYNFDATYAASGQYNLWGYNLGGSLASPMPASDSNIRMTSSVMIPSNAYLHFKHAYGFEDFSSDYYDGGMIEYSIDGGSTWLDAGSLIVNNGYNGTIYLNDNNPLKGRSAFVAESNGYISTRLNLANFAGQNMRFRFRIGTDSTFDDYGWFIDDVRIYTCVAASATATPTVTATRTPTATSATVSPTWTVIPTVTPSPTATTTSTPALDKRGYIPLVEK